MMSGDVEQISTVPAVPERPDNAHKGTFGTVIVIGGHTTMPGAPALCADAALRGGAGLVRIATHASVLQTALTIEPCATGVILGDPRREDLEQLDRADPQCTSVLAVGPGMGTDDWATRLIAALVRGRRSMVLDADGLNVLATRPDLRRGADCSLIMTPHPGEFRRLARPMNIREDPTDPDQRPAAAVAMARVHRSIVVLKGKHSIITDGHRIFINPTGNAALATAGAGDVLTGVIAALLAQGMAPFDAAQLGTYLHGMAGDLWEKKHGPSGLTAKNLANLLPAAFQVHRQKRVDRE